MTAPLRLVFAPSALRDLDEILAWYSGQQAPEVGYRLVGQVIAQAGDLLQYPDLGRIVPEFGTVSLRELIHPPFRIVYRLEKGAVQIVRVWRSERLMAGETVSQKAPSLRAGKGKRKP